MSSSKRMLIAPAVLLIALTSAAQQKRTFHDRDAVAGNYTVGLYADANGTQSKLVLESDQIEFEAWIGLTGDSTRVFSGTAFGLDLPREVQIDGAIRWNTMPGLSQWGVVTAQGVQAEFAQSCARQTTRLPAMLGRIRFSVEEDFLQGTLVVRPHVKHGLSVELCYLDGDWWPKPFAEPVSLEVERKQGFWDRLRNLFR